MAYQQFNASRALMVHHAKECISEASQPTNHHSIIITPMILDRMEYKLPENIYGDIVFVDFNVDHPLYIPKHVTFHGDVVISQSILKGIADANFKKDLYLHDVDLDFKHPPSKVAGRIFMSKEFFEDYRKLRLSYRSIPNRTIIVQDDAVLRKKVDNLYHQAKPLSFNKVVDHFSLKTEITDSEYLIQGDVYLHGPYPYNFPKQLVIQGNLIVFEEAAYQYPDELVVEGVFDIRGSL